MIYWGDDVAGGVEFKPNILRVVGVTPTNGEGAETRFLSIEAKHALVSSRVLVADSNQIQETFLCSTRFPSSLLFFLSHQCLLVLLLFPVCLMSWSQRQASTQ